MNEEAEGDRDIIMQSHLNSSEKSFVRWARYRRPPAPSPVDRVGIAHNKIFDTADGPCCTGFFFIFSFLISDFTVRGSVPLTPEYPSNVVMWSNS
ncbi:hypothetical protein EVAR_104004_1 [Eumeta japonica]|uniref:Uncharacterized protein n=1 Tax=Eumeta variegata TaxID=151549 RepID=A0A4C1XZB2_EUMVA|nr:hypothetical protein EVAR_104004_1 [Eumeta japonica]